MFEHPAPLRPIISNSLPCTPTTTLPSSTLPSVSPSSSSSYCCHPAQAIPQSLRTHKQKRCSGDDVTSRSAASESTFAAPVDGINVSELWAAEWPTMIHIPSSFMYEWASAFSDALLRLSRCPNLENLAYVFCSTKLLLAAPAHGGKQRLHTIERLLRNRFSKWHSGQLALLFSEVSAAWSKRGAKKPHSLLTY